MKIAIASHGLFPDSIGGMERHTFNLARELSRRGHDVHVLAPRPETAKIYPFAVHRLPWPKRPFWLWSNRAFSEEAGRWIDCERPDVAVSQGFALWRYLGRRRAPCVFHPHGLEMFGGFMTPTEWAVTVPFRRLVRIHGRRADATVSLGGRLTGILRERAGIPADRIVEIPNAVDTAAFVPPDGTKVPNSLLFVGRLVFNKGLDLLAEAVRRSPHLPFALTIAGDGPLRPLAEELARVDPRVRYLPAVSEDELKVLYRESEALVFTSRFEGMPTVILEAMASGCGIVATDIGAVRAAVTQETGFVIPPTAEAIRDGLGRWVACAPEQRVAMGRNARRAAEASFSWERVGEAYERLFLRIQRVPVSGSENRPGLGS
jgi:glycosyltransferase involved in cell wall biosynthesis